MSPKIMGVIVVLLAALVSALVSGIVAFALGSTNLAALTTGGAAFVGIAGLGLGVLGYLTPDTPSAG
ncbi:hypothetical protein [Streptomyces sp. NPDC005485]|uniref:hypothetical protein n=1 Tax=Streptomyces sp. NPDC005485 TaxID=3155591 RepID=UPI0033BCDF8A